jgi:crotonobetainyl-CoA:carnitine CoA-transferase CaiB-like acyl-CoA transferase
MPDTSTARTDSGDSTFRGVRVVDATAGVGGAYAAMILADHGCDVVRVEPPGGDPARGTAAFHVLNRGKESIVLDTHSEAGRHELADLAARADVFLYDVPPGERKSVGLDSMLLRREHPSLIFGYLPAYGSEGPYADLAPDELLVQAVSGVCEAQFRYDPPPVMVNIPIAGYAQGIVAANAVAASLYARARSGIGDEFEVSAVAAIFAMQTGAYVLGEHVQRMAGARDPHGPIPTYRLVRASDDWLFAGALTPGFWASLAVALGLEDCLVDPRFAGAPLAIADSDARAELTHRVDAAFATRPRDEWLRILEEAGVPRAPVLSRDEYARDEQVAHNRMMIALDGPAVGSVRQMGVPVWLRDTPGRVRCGAPLLGEHRRAGGWQTVEARPPRERSAGEAEPGGPPLDGVRVLDLSGFIAGANGGMLLSDMGADVIKVESPDGDSWRTSGLGFLGANRGKRSVVIDLKRPEGRDLILEMVERADVLMDNYRPGVMDRHGLGWDVLRARNPRLIHCSVTGYGPTGPYAHLPGFDPLFQARSGLMRAQGEPGGEPVYLQLSLVDYATAINAAFGVVAALNARERTGHGQRVETCLLNNAFIVQPIEFVTCEGGPPERSGGRDLRGRHAFYRMYEAADASLAIACTTEQQVIRLAGALGLMLPAETDVLALDLHGEVAAAVAGCLATRERARWLALLRAAAVPAAPCLRVDDLFQDEHMAANNLWYDTEHPRWGAIRQTGAVIAWQLQPMRLARRAPMLGEHTSEVLDELGMEIQRVRGLLDDGVLMQA